MAFGLQAFWAYHLFFNSTFYGLLCYFFGPGCCDFLDLNRGSNQLSYKGLLAISFLKLN